MVSGGSESQKKTQVSYMNITSYCKRKKKKKIMLRFLFHDISNKIKSDSLHEYL